MKVFYLLNKEDLTCTFWHENDPNNKQTVKGRWQTYSGDRASKNNTRVIFSNLPSFCDPQKTITIDPNTPEGNFTPRLNTKTHTGATSKKLFEYVKAFELSEYLENESDKETLKTLLEKAKQVFDKRQVETHKAQINRHIEMLKSLGLTPESFCELLKQQQTQTQTGGENE